MACRVPTLNAELLPATEVAIWERLLVPQDDPLAAAKATLVLQLRFPDKDVRRMRQLSAKARSGTLTPDERAEMETYERVGHVVSILKARARQVLKGARSPS